MEDRAALVEALQRKVDELIANDIPTRVLNLPYDPESVESHCLPGAGEITHLSSSKPVRVVCVAGERGTLGQRQRRGERRRWDDFSTIFIY